MAKFSPDEVNALMDSSFVFLKWAIGLGFIFNLICGVLVFFVLDINSFTAFYAIAFLGAPFLIAISLYNTIKSQKFTNTFKLNSNPDWSSDKTLLMWAVAIFWRAFVVQLAFELTLVPILFSLGVGDPPLSLIVSMLSVWIAFWWCAYQSFSFEPEIQSVL